MDRLDCKQEGLLILEEYNRYKGDIVDYTISSTCGFLLYWMERQERFGEVIFRPGENRGNLREVWGEKAVKEIIQRSKLECKDARHRKKTFDKCWEFLLRDLRVEGKNGVG